MPEDNRLWDRKRLITHSYIGVTNPGGDNSNEDLVDSWFRQVNSFERSRRARDGCRFFTVISGRNELLNAVNSDLRFVLS
jgi:hypothetical protein